MELSDEDMEDLNEDPSEEDDEEGGAQAGPLKRKAGTPHARPSRRRRGVEIEYEEEREPLQRQID